MSSISLRTAPGRRPECLVCRFLIRGWCTAARGVVFNVEWLAKCPIDITDRQHECLRATENQGDTLRPGGWSMSQDANGFWRASRRIDGKVRTVYIGKRLSDASSKIAHIEHELTKGAVADTASVGGGVTS